MYERSVVLTQYSLCTCYSVPSGISTVVVSALLFEFSSICTSFDSTNSKFPFQPSQLTARQRALGGEDGAILSQVMQINIGNQFNDFVF